MAKIASKDIGLYVNQGTDIAPTWVMIACSTSDGFSGSTDNVEIATKCSGGWKENLPGDSTWSFTNSGYAEKIVASAPLTAGSFVIGDNYTITTVGTTDFTLVGAASSTVGEVFTATGAGTGTGTATAYPVRESYVSAEDLFHTKGVKQFKLAAKDEADYYRMGSGYVSDYNETSDNGDYLQFDLTVTGSGDYITTPVV